MPSTGTPQPGGLDWYQVINLIRSVARERQIVGADIMELMPIGGLRAPDFLAAKLAYKIIGYKFFAR
jgi:agmatinase